MKIVKSKKYLWTFLSFLILLIIVAVASMSISPELLQGKFNSSIRPLAIQNKYLKSLTKPSKKLLNNSNSGLSLNTKYIHTDGHYELTEGGTATASNGVKIEIVDITHPYDHTYYFHVNFYVRDDLLNLAPINFASSDESNYNVFYGVRLTYSHDLIERNGLEYISLELDSYEEGPINSCHDLVDACLSNGYNRLKCNKFCEKEPVDGEVLFENGNFTLIIDEDFRDIGESFLNQMEQCFDADLAFMQIEPVTDKLIVRVVPGAGAVVTRGDSGSILWPAPERANAEFFMEPFLNANPNICDNNTMAHEIIHYLLGGVAIKPFYNEGLAMFGAEQIVSEEFPIVCHEEGWSRDGQYNVKHIQRLCFSSLRRCYENSDMIEGLFLGAPYVFHNGMQIVIDGINAELEEISFSILDENSDLIDSQTLVIGQLYDDNDLIFLLYQIWEDEELLIESYTNPIADPPMYCENNARDMCDMMIDPNQMRYSDPEEYLASDRPYNMTFPMFYNTAKCFFEEIYNASNNGFLDFIEAASENRDSIERFCMGDELRNHLAPEDFQALEEKFGFEHECYSGTFTYSDSNIWDPARQE